MNAHSVLKRIARIIIWLITGIFVFAVVGATYQAIATARDAQAFPAPGQLIDVGGYKMHIVRTGPQNTSNRTVILDHVRAANAAQWGLVQPEIAKTTRVCAYDRAGFGWSERGPTPRDALQSMHELHTLLGKAGISAPYIPVGHSYGPNVARLYVAEYPNEVVSMVPVDLGHLFDTPGVSSKVSTGDHSGDPSGDRGGSHRSAVGSKVILIFIHLAQPRSKS